MTTWWATDPQTGRGVPLNDAAAQEAAAEGWTVTQYDNQDGGIGQYGIDPNANAPHQITADKVLVYNANTQRYEWMSQALVAAQQAATGQYGAETQRAATMADIIAASRGPENAFQYANALHGAPDAAGIGIFDALAGRLGGSTTAGTPAQGDLHPIDIMGKVQALLARSMGTGGSTGSGSSAWAQQAGMAGTQKEQQAQGAAQDASQTPQAGQQTAQAASGGVAGTTSAGVPLNALGKVDTGAYARASGLSGSGSSDIAWKNKSHDLIQQMGYGHGSDARNAAHLAAGMTGEEFDRIIKHGGNPFQKTSASSNSGQNQQNQKTFKHDTDTHTAWSGAHGDTSKTAGTHISNAYAKGGTRVVTGPQTIRVGEGGKDELIQVTPLERADTPVPRSILNLANSLSPDRDHMRGMGMATGGTVAALSPDPMAAAPVSDPPPGMGAPPTDPLAGGATPLAGAGGFDPTSPQQTPEALQQIAALLRTPPAPTDGPITQAVRANWALGQDGTPQFIGGQQQAPAPPPPMGGPQPNPDGSMGMAAGGGLAVIGGGTTVTQANKPANAAGQVVVPYNRGHRTVPVGKTTPLPNFGNLPPALLSLISPSDWKLIGSQYGAAGGNAADIPFLLQRSLQGLGRAPGAFGGRVF